MYSFWKTNSDSTYIFNRYDWVKFIKDTLDEFSSHSKINLEVITPWGFEVFDNTEFLTKHLRRFYCYIGVSSTNLQPIDMAQLEYDVATTIVKKLKVKDINFYNKIIGILAGEAPVLFRDPKYFCEPTDCFISVTARYSDDILSAYANYIICTLDSITRDIGEVAQCKKNLITRWRLFQLYLIHEELFGYLLPKLTEELQDFNKLALSYTCNYVWPFYKPKSANIVASNIESEIIDKLIIPRINQVFQAIKKDKSNLIQLKSQSFHYNLPLTIEISQDIYETAFKKIISTYKSFGY